MKLRIIDEVIADVEAGRWRNHLVFYKGEDKDEPWCGRGNEPGCLVQLIARRSGSMHPMAKSPERLAADEITAAISTRVGYSVITWNDEPGRNREEVIAVLRQVFDHFRRRA